MSAPWKAVMSYNRYASVAASAVRNALKPDAKVKAARRGEMTLKYQDWKDGHSTDPVRRPCPACCAPRLTPRFSFRPSSLMRSLRPLSPSPSPPKVRPSSIVTGSRPSVARLAQRRHLRNANSSPWSRCCLLFARSHIVYASSGMTAQPLVFPVRSCEIRLRVVTRLASSRVRGLSTGTAFPQKWVSVRCLEARRRCWRGWEPAGCDGP